MSEDQFVDAVFKRSARMGLIAATAVVLTLIQPFFAFSWWKVLIAFGAMSTTRGTYLIALAGLAFLFALVVIPPELAQAVWKAATTN